MQEISLGPLPGYNAVTKWKRTLKHLPTPIRLAIKLCLEFLPLALFFLTSTHYSFYVSTGVLMGATVVSLLLTWWLFRQLALMAIITALTGFVSGTLTLVLVDPVYVKMKPTIVSSIFALILATGLWRRQPLFKTLLGQNLALNAEGWRVLTWLWLGYFIFITVLNEFIWRNYSTEFWITFKAFGLMPMTVTYALPQMYLLKKYQLPTEKAGKKVYKFDQTRGDPLPLKNSSPKTTTP